MSDETNHDHDRMHPCLACSGRCTACGRPWCPNETPSPGEGDGLCVECWLGLDGGEE